MINIKPKPNGTKGINIMKKMTFLAVMLMVAAALTSCGANKQVAQQQPTQPRPIANDNGGLGKEIDMPCVFESMDDEDYFRDMGTATSINMQSARTAALQAAQDMIMQKLGGYVEGLSESYSRTVAGQAQQEKVQRLMESDMNKVVQERINHAQKVCEKMYDKGANGYTSFIAIQIPVKKLIDDMADVLSEDEELTLEFNRERFRKYAEEKQKQMLEHQRERNGK